MTDDFHIAEIKEKREDEMTKARLRRVLLLAFLLEFAFTFGGLCIVDGLSPRDQVEWWWNLGLAGTVVVISSMMSFSVWMFLSRARTKRRE